MKETLKEKMKKRLAKVVGNESGVTLIELLAVVVILAIIAAVAVPAVLSNFKTSKLNTDKQNAAIIVDAINRLITSEDSVTGGNITLINTGVIDGSTGAYFKGTKGDDGFYIGSLLLKGSPDTSNQAFLNSLPTPQSSPTANPEFQIVSSQGSGDYKDFPTFTIGNTTYYVYPN